MPARRKARTRSTTEPSIRELVERGGVRRAYCLERPFAGEGGRGRIPATAAAESGRTKRGLAKSSWATIHIRNNSNVGLAHDVFIAGPTPRPPTFHNLSKQSNFAQKI
jgi:hypothetical protein